MVKKGDIRMKTLPFTEKELDMLIRNAQKNYYCIIQNINKEEREFLTQDTSKLLEQHFDILNRLHQQAMIYSNQIRKYSAMRRIMYAKYGM